MTENISALPAPSENSPDGRSSSHVAPTYWQIIAARFYTPAFTKVALGFVYFVCLTAVFIPFIASAVPYTVELKDPVAGHWTRSYPLFRDLQPGDLVILSSAACLLFFWMQLRRTRNKDIEIRHRLHFRWMIVTAIMGCAIATLILTLYPSRLDENDYKALTNTGQARNAVFAPIAWGYADQEPLEMDLVNKPPSWVFWWQNDPQWPVMKSHWHWLGTDQVGRDALSRLLWSTRVVLGIGLVSQLIAISIGLLYGALMGYFASAVDILGMRFVEMIEAIPTLFLIIIFVAIVGREILLIMVIIGLTSWTGISRYVRAEFLRIRQLDYVQAAIAGGLPLRSVLFRHIMPNALSSVLVVISFGIAGAVTSESILSYLGLGVEPPTPSWGNMLNEAGNPGDIFRPWLAFGPGLMIFLTIFACNILGEGLRDAIDPRALGPKK